jgi:hypothetical protein
MPYMPRFETAVGATLVFVRLELARPRTRRKILHLA